MSSAACEQPPHPPPQPSLSSSLRPRLPFPVEVRTARIPDLAGAGPVDLVRSDYADCVMLMVSQNGGVGAVVEATRQAPSAAALARRRAAAAARRMDGDGEEEEEEENEDPYVYYSRVLLGRRDDPLLILLARRVVEAVATGGGAGGGGGGGGAAGPATGGGGSERLLLCLSLDPRALPPPGGRSPSSQDAAGEGMLVSPQAMAAARRLLEAVKGTGILAPSPGESDPSLRMEGLD